jgi:hypothetical protein
VFDVALVWLDIPDDLIGVEAGADLGSMVTVNTANSVVTATGTSVWEQKQSDVIFSAVVDGLGNLTLYSDDLEDGREAWPDAFILTPQAAAAIPEPSTFALAALGLLALGIVGRRPRRSRG